MIAFLPAHWSSSNSFLLYFEVLLSNTWVVFVGHSHTSLALPLWPQLMQCTVEDKSGRLRDSRRSWPSDRSGFKPKPNASLPFVQMVFVPLCFSEIQGENGRT